MPDQLKQPRARRAPLSERRLAHAVLARASLKDVRLASCAVKHSLSGPHHVRSVSLNVYSEPKVYLNDRKLSVRVQFAIVATPEQGSDESMAIDCEFILHYD